MSGHDQKRGTACAKECCTNGAGGTPTLISTSVRRPFRGCGEATVRCSPKQCQYKPVFLLVSHI